MEENIHGGKLLKGGNYSVFDLYDLPYIYHTPCIVITRRVQCTYDLLLIHTYFKIRSDDKVYFALSVADFCLENGCLSEGSKMKFLLNFCILVLTCCSPHPKMIQNSWLGKYFELLQVIFNEIDRFCWSIKPRHDNCLSIICYQNCSDLLWENKI